MLKTGADLIKHLGELAFATRIKRLGDALQQDVGNLYAQLEVDFEPKWFTMLYALYHNGTMSIIELAALLKLTHPAIIQFAEQMQEKKLLQTIKDKSDGRRKLLQLTEKGKNTYQKIEPVLNAIESSTRDFLRETGTDVLGLIEKMEKQLDDKSMYQRVNDKLNSKLRQEIQIVSYRSEFKEAFRKLNYEWLKKYFTIEPIDEKIFSNPAKEIIKDDGEIFFALLDGEPIGTCAMKKTGSKTYELLKMAVTDRIQSRGVGRMLAEKAIEFAKEKGAEEIELDTNRKLEKAMTLYQNLGFVVSEKQPSKEYQRSTIKMKKVIKNTSRALSRGRAKARV